jgi:hypothetical protein
MHLKYWTTALLGFGLTLVLAAPLALSGKPEDPSSRAAKEWLIRFGLYVGATTIVWALVALLAVLLIRKIRREMMAEREVNMNILLEKAMKDHAEHMSSQGNAQGG